MCADICLSAFPFSRFFGTIEDVLCNRLLCAKGGCLLQNNPTGSGASRRAMLVLMSLNTLYQYMYCMMLSSALSLAPVFGGALLLSARVAIELARLTLGSGRKGLPHRIRVACMVLLSFMLLCNLLLLAVYPALLQVDTLWILFAVVVLLTFRAEFSRRLTAWVMRGAIRKAMFAVLLFLLHGLPAGIAAGLLFSFLPPGVAWQMLGGFALGSLLECHSLWRERASFAEDTGYVAPGSQGSLTHMARELREISAYHAYERIHLPVLMALQMTLVMVYTFVGLAAGELLTCLILSAGLTLFMREATDFLIRSLKDKRPATTPLLLVGLGLWIYGLVLFYRRLGSAPGSLFSYLSLGLSVSGLTIATTCLADLERQMASVARFGLENQLEGYPQVRRAATEMAILLGQMAALALLTPLCVPAGFSLQQASLDEIARNFRPLMILPPLLLLAAAMVSVLRFPVNHRYFQKLARFFTIQEEGGDNPALQKQLDSVVVKRHKNRFGIKIIIALLRPMYYHKVIGKENAAPHEDGSMVLVCNHGELYGPIVTNLYIPISFRPWIIGNLMSREAVVKHIYQGTMIRQKWLPEAWKIPLLRLVSTPLVWICESLEGIPVHRGSPRELIQTFRQTIEAMQAGDNILLFPETGENSGDGEKGYVAEGVGELYTGFTMLAPMYYAKTQKNAVFMPIYASKRLRTLTIGEGIVYNPSASAPEEKFRIVNALQQSMQAMYQQELDTVAAQNEKRRLLLKARRRLSPGQAAELEALEREAGKR